MTSDDWSFYGMPGGAKTRTEGAPSHPMSVSREIIESRARLERLRIPSRHRDAESSFRPRDELLVHTGASQSRPSDGGS